MGFDEWLTPPPLIEKVRGYYGGAIDLDPATNDVAQRYVQALDYYTAETDGLIRPWFGNVWLNPPYSRGLIDAFADKAVTEWKLAAPSQMLVLVNSQTDTGWYHKLLNSATAVLLFRGRLKFWKIQNGQAYERWESSTTGKVGNSPRFLNSLFYYSRDVANIVRFGEQFRDEGRIIWL